MAHTIEFKGEKIIEIKEGQSILEASLQAGIPHYHECGGKAKCSTCRILGLLFRQFKAALGMTDRGYRWLGPGRPAFSGLDGVHEQHGPGHRADAADPGRQPAGHLIG